LACSKQVSTQKHYAIHGSIEFSAWLVCFALAIFHSWFWLLAALFISMIRASMFTIQCAECRSPNVHDANASIVQNHIKTLQDNQTKPCPYCAEPIKLAAIVCKHCGKDLPAA